MTGSTSSCQAADETIIRIFVSYDLDHDADLLDRLVEQEAEALLGFEISGLSASRSVVDHGDVDLRRAIQQADQVIVLCGEHTEMSDRVANEVLIAQEEDRPYVLLWGRRDLMCTKPLTAARGDSMYSWTNEILRSQLVMNRRDATDSDKRQLAERQSQ